ncbi:hypothetical protein D3C77_395050 [compost metagenome]
MPACLNRHPEDVFLSVVVACFKLIQKRLHVSLSKVGGLHVVVVIRISELLAQFFLPLFKGVGDILQENQAQHHMLVDGGIQVGAQLVSGGPELLFQLAEKLLFDGVHRIIP